MPHSGIITIDDLTLPARQHEVNNIKDYGFSGKTRIEVSIIEESNPRLLAFNSGALDYVNVPSDLSDTVLDAAGNLRPAYKERAVTLARVTQPALQYAYFNMEVRWSVATPRTRSPCAAQSRWRSTGHR